MTTRTVDVDQGYKVTVRNVGEEVQLTIHGPNSVAWVWLDDEDAIQLEVALERAVRELASAEPAFVRPPVPELSRARPAGEPPVMLDPGHGGYDPGTHSASGIDEKTLALQIARCLALRENSYPGHYNSAS